MLPEAASRSEIVQFVLSGGQSAKPSFSKQVSFSTVIDKYFAAYTQGKEDSTIAGERIHTSHLLRLIGKGRLFRGIDSDTLQQYAAKRQREKGQRGRKLSVETVKKEFHTFAQVWVMARAKGYVSGPSQTKEVKLDLPDGHKGALSEVCVGVTREPPDGSEGRGTGSFMGGPLKWAKKQTQ
ncbi:MAG: hypothetical protein RBS80_26875 [Thermoguttaceae bacterium]|nr:hypothetical protein [Thermoguttaceae bacterium]